MPKDFISLVDWPAADLLGLVKASQTFRRWWIDGNSPPVLKGRRIALIWGAAGFRNRVAFELGIAELGGITVEIRPPLDEIEPLEDVARYLDNWFDAIVARTAAHAHMLRLAASVRIPVINARTRSTIPARSWGSRLHSGSARHFEGAARRIRRCRDESWTLLVRSGSDASN